MTRVHSARLLALCAGLCAGLALPGLVAAQGRGGVQSEEELLFQQAETAFNAGNFDEASPLYERVAVLNSARSEAWVRRAVIFYRRKQYSEAVQLLRRAQQSLPNDVPVKAQLALALYRTGAQEMAVGMLEEVAAVRPEMPDVQLQLGTHYVRVGDGKRAAATMEAYAKTRADTSDQATQLQIRLLAGSAYLLNRQYTEAQREFEAALKLRPEDEVARISLGQVFAGRGDCSQAITLYEKLVPLAQKRPFIYYDLGACYFKVNRRLEAEKMAAAYTELRPKETKGYVLLGDARTEGRDFNGAAIAYEKARALEPTLGGLDARMGRVFIGQKNYAGAIGLLERALAAKPDDLDLMTQLTDAYAATRQPAEKLARLGKALQKAARPGDVDALTAAGVAYYAAGEDEEAQALFSGALKAQPSARRARSGLQMALSRSAGAALRRNDLAAAEAAVTRAQEIDVESLQANRNLGLVLLLSKKYQPAEAALRAALKKVPRDAVVNRLLARALIGTRRRDEAITAYEIAVEAALRTRGPALAEVYVELGPLYSDAGRHDQAVSVLETATTEAGQTPALTAAQRNLALALYRRGQERLKDPKLVDAALEDLGRAARTTRPALAAKEQAAIGCTLAATALRAGKADVAAAQFSKLARDKESCQFRPPYDRIGTELLAAYAQYRNAADAEALDGAAKTFQRLGQKATGALATLLTDLARSSYERQGFLLYGRGEDKRAAVALRSATKIVSKGELRELEHNLAVIDLADGRTTGAERAFESLGGKPPEAYINLGILADRQGDTRRALDLYRRGLDRGARGPKLRDWIDVKERMLGVGK